MICFDYLLRWVVPLSKVFSLSIEYRFECKEFEISFFETYYKWFFVCLLIYVLFEYLACFISGGDIPINILMGCHSFFWWMKAEDQGRQR